MKKLKRIFMSSIILGFVLLSATGCGQKVDHTMINKAFANSAIMVDINIRLQEQGALIDEMRRLGIITDMMAYNMEERLNTLNKGIATLSNEVPKEIRTTTTTTTNTSTSYTPQIVHDDGTTTDGSANTTVDTRSEVVEYIEIGSHYHEVVASVLRSLTMLGENLPITDSIPPGEELADVDEAQAFVQAYGSPLDAYSGYNTAAIINSSSTSYANIAGFIDGNDNIPLNPFGYNINGQEDATLIESVVAHINGLKDIEVFYVNPAKVKDTTAIQGLKKAIDEAKSGQITAENLAIDYFTSTGQLITFVEEEIDVNDAYKVEERKVVERLADGTSHHSASYNIKLLQGDVLLNAFRQEQITGDLSSGVLIGNRFFITRYPVAVFRGFQRDALTDTNYLPIFTHPHFSEYYSPDIGTLRGSAFSGTDSSYTELMLAGDVGTAESKSAYIDLYTGDMYYDGEPMGKSHIFMSVGSADIESAFVVKPASNVFTVDGNPVCITTVDQTQAQIDGLTVTRQPFIPTETIQIGTQNSVRLQGSELPVVFLTEYLELLYSPNTVGSDAFTAYGRKVKLDENIILGTDPITASTGNIAYIVGEGARISEWRTAKNSFIGLDLTDFMDIDGIYESDFSLKSKTSDGEPNEVSAVVRYIPAGTTNFELGGIVRSGDAAAERSDILPQIAAGRGLECVMMFGSTGLNAADSSATPKIPLFGVTLYGSLYDRGLFSQWINVSGNAPLIKWGQNAAELGYKSYTISGAVLTENLKGNYAFELNEEGLLHIDLNTVVQINKETVEARKGGGIVLLRTVLLILGFILVAYVSVLLAAWSLDVNLDLGFNLLEKVSFGHFVAVRSLDEMPDPDPESTTTYVDFRTLILRAIAFASVGVILITIDPINLIIKLLMSLKFIIGFLGEKIFGISL